MRNIIVYMQNINQFNYVMQPQILKENNREHFKQIQSLQSLKIPLFYCKNTVTLNLSWLLSLFLTQFLP